MEVKNPVRINHLTKALLFILFSCALYGNVVTLGGNKLDIRESSGRFKFYSEDDKGKELSLISDGDPRTSSFSIFEDNAFYTLGDTFRFRRRFVEKDLGGIFTWESRNLKVVQEFELSYEGELKLSFNITNSSEAPLKTGLKILFDSAFEDDKRFVLSTGTDRKIINSEYEMDDAVQLEFIASGALSGKGKGLMIYPLSPDPNRLVLGNWDILDDADYYYRSVEGRNFNNPPYSINDSAILLLYSPRDVLPGNTVGFSLVLKVIDSVESPEQIPSPVKESAEAPKETVATEPSVVAESTAIEETQNEVEQEPEPSAPVPETSEEPAVEESPEISEEEEPSQVEEPAEVKPEPEIATEEASEDITPQPAPSSEEKAEAKPPAESQVKTFIEQSLESVEDINDMIKSLSNPGMLTESNLSRLEELIDKLEKLNIDENTQ